MSSDTQSAPSVRPPVPGVALPKGQSGSTFLHTVLAAAVGQFPEALAPARFPPDSRTFRNTFGDALVRFEAARAASPQRAQMAQAIRQQVASSMMCQTAQGLVPLTQAMASSLQPSPVTVVKTQGPGRYLPVVPQDGTPLTGAALSEWIRGARSRSHLSHGVVDALQRLIDSAGTEGLSLVGQRFVVLGAGAELAPTRELLAAGATVLWMDVRPPPDALLQSTSLGGELHIPEQPCDLLQAPLEALATVKAFAAQGPVHIGMYAYAGGESREWRLCESMNALVDALPPAQVRSVSMLISPTSVMVTQPADMDEAVARRTRSTLVSRSLERAGMLKPSHFQVADTSVAYAVVPLQGASYQAAQYVGKTLAAEARAVDMPHVTVSANVAPITATRSLSHPVFEAGFLFAADYGVWIARPEVTRALQANLMLADLMENREAGNAFTAADAARLFSRQVHGGVYAQPNAFLGMIQMSAARGLAAKPGLLVRIMRGA